MIFHYDFFEFYTRVAVSFRGRGSVYRREKETINSLIWGTYGNISFWLFPNVLSMANSCMYLKDCRKLQVTNCKCNNATSIIGILTVLKTNPLLKCSWSHWMFYSKLRLLRTFTTLTSEENTLTMFLGLWMDAVGCLNVRIQGWKRVLVPFWRSYQTSFWFFIYSANKFHSQQSVWVF